MLLFRLVKGRYETDANWQRRPPVGPWVDKDAWEQIRQIHLALKDGPTGVRIWGDLREADPRTALTSLKLPPAPYYYETEPQALEWGIADEEKAKEDQVLEDNCTADWYRENVEREAFEEGLVEWKDETSERWAHERAVCKEVWARNLGWRFGPQVWLDRGRARSAGQKISGGCGSGNRSAYSEHKPDNWRLTIY